MEHTHNSPSSSVVPMQENLDKVNPTCYCFAMRKVARAVTQIYDRALEPTGIRSTQFTLLVTMASSNAQTLTEMANALVMDRTTLTRNLKPLEKMGFIQTAEAKDKRSKAYILTQQGRDVVNRAVPKWKSAQARVNEALGESEAQMLLSKLDEAARSISEI